MYFSVKTIVITAALLAVTVNAAPLSSSEPVLIQRNTVNAEGIVKPIWTKRTNKLPGDGIETATPEKGEQKRANKNQSGDGAEGLTWTPAEGVDASPEKGAQKRAKPEPSPSKLTDKRLPGDGAEGVKWTPAEAEDASPEKGAQKRASKSSQGDGAEGVSPQGQ